MLLNRNGIKIELPSSLMSGPHARKEQEIYIDKVLLRHMWSRPDQKVEFWKFYANCELQIYICDLPQLLKANLGEIGCDGTSVEDPTVYQIASGFPFKDFKHHNMQISPRKKDDDQDHDEDRDIQTQQLRFFFFHQDLKQFKEEKSMLQKGAEGRDSFLGQTSGSDTDEAQQGKQSGVDSDSPLGAIPEVQRSRSRDDQDQRKAGHGTDASPEKTKQGAEKEEKNESQDDQSQANSDAESSKREDDDDQENQADSNEQKNKRNSSARKIDAGKNAFSRLPLNASTTSSSVSKGGATSIAEKNIKKCDYLEFIVSLQRCNHNWLPQFDEESQPSAKESTATSPLKKISSSGLPPGFR